MDAAQIWVVLAHLDAAATENPQLQPPMSRVGPAKENQKVGKLALA